MTSRGTSSATDLMIAHLSMIQGIIGRMSGFSASAKNFCITICAAIIAVGFQNGAPMLSWAALGVVVLFFLMDTYYLSLERRYREFYEEVTKRSADAEPDLSMKAERLTISHFAKAMGSVSVLPFYALLVASMLSLLYVAAHVQHTSTEASTIRTGSNAGAAKPANGQRTAVSIGERSSGGSEAQSAGDRERAQSVHAASANSTSTR